MSTILDDILREKRQELVSLKKTYPLAYWENDEMFQRETISLKSRLEGAKHTNAETTMDSISPAAMPNQMDSNICIISEFKRRSPSKGAINEKAKVAEVTAGYEKSGATGISVLANEHFFGGSLQDVKEARQNAPHTPILFKEFVVDEYQLYMAKAAGADVILLIAAALSIEDCLHLAAKAKELHLEVLLELHDETELNHLHPNIDIVGINNRNLKNFEVNIETGIRLSQYLPSDCVKISESGISKAASLIKLHRAGFQGFLMGENFMKEENPAQALQDFIQEVKHLMIEF